MKKVYHYHPDTKEFLGESVPRKDPKDPESYLIPAYAVEETPPLLIKGKARIYENGRWVYVQDHRGKTVWKTDGSGDEVMVTELGNIAVGWTLTIEDHRGKTVWKTDGSGVSEEIKKVGAISAEWTTVPYVPLSIWNGSTWVLNRALAIERKSLEVSVAREKRIAEGVPYDFSDGRGTVQTRNLVDVRNIQTNVIAALIFQGAGKTRPIMVFRDSENVTHRMTPAQMLAMAVAISQYGQVIYNRSWELKDGVEGMTTEQIAAFDVEANW